MSKNIVSFYQFLKRMFLQIIECCFKLRNFQLIAKAFLQFRKTLFFDMTLAFEISKLIAQ